jgi:hypothetical protein
MAIRRHSAIILNTLSFARSTLQGSGISALHLGFVLQPVLEL